MRRKGVSLLLMLLALLAVGTALVHAPDLPGLFAVSHRVVVQNLAETSSARHPTVSAAQRVPPAAVPAQGPPVDNSNLPLLFTIEVTGEKQPMDLPVTQQTNPACASTPKPKNCWPDTPYYLQDLPSPGGEPRSVAFSMDGNPGTHPTPSISMGGNTMRTVRMRP